MTRMRSPLLIGVRQREYSEIRLPINDRQRFNQLVDDHHFGIRLVVGLRHVVQIDLQHDILVYHDTRAVAGPDRPEHSPRSGRPSSADMLLTLSA
jgi:hypothetical protein